MNFGEIVITSLSIITRTCDRLTLLRRCLESLEERRSENMEWIVVDDEPSGNADVAKFVERTREEWSYPIHLVNARTKHRAKAANAGLAAATGTMIHFLDDDDSIAPDFYVRRLLTWSIIHDTAPSLLSPKGWSSEQCRTVRFGKWLEYPIIRRLAEFR